ncbi:hypothetical protein KOR42_12910 [Thalassoglobus neptunius]|uniref:Uncharacterized protein n=1 Tax=Thalassoglobus neptunius TaxID=1938619 RepID=A0A5C5X6N2_9PLAN|nr:hypothetical protein KOR42_12910 [Thalassoglobus neptunius]
MKRGSLDIYCPCFFGGKIVLRESVKRSRSGHYRDSSGPDSLCDFDELATCSFSCCLN